MIQLARQSDVDERIERLFAAAIAISEASVVLILTFDIADLLIGA
jgi:hypothetical protein